MTEHELTLQVHGQGVVHGVGRIGAINNRIAVLVTSAVGSMWCAYLFIGLACISLPAAIRSGDPVVIVAWISQTFVQLVLLSIIMVGQRVSAAADDARSISDHLTLQFLSESQKQQIEILTGQSEILELLKVK